MSDLPPHLKKILLKICQRHERRGTLGGMMKLGQDLDEAHRRAIENFFGLAPLKSTGKNELKLSLDRLLAEKNPEQIADWLSHLYRLMGRIRPEPAAPIGEEFRLLCDQLRLAFPRLQGVHQFFRDSHDNLPRKLQASMPDVQDLFFTCAKIVDFLLDNEKAITLSDLGARFCGSSKRLRQGRLKSLVEQWLALMRPDLPDEAGVWQEFLVIQDRLTVNALIFGPIIYQKNGKEYDWINRLYQAGEPALVSWFHLEGITSCRLAGKNGDEPILITCENEAPFSILLREKEERVLLLYTAGFPNRAVRRLYDLLAPHTPCRLHWGDSDPAGLRIAAILHEIHSLNLWRCDLATLQHHQEKLLPLKKSQEAIAASLLEVSPAFPFQRELAFTLKHGWLEQESWQAEIE